MIHMQSAQDQQMVVTIGKYVVRCLDSTRTLLVDDKAIQFTPTEYRLLLRLLSGEPVSDRELVLAILNSRIEEDLWAREALSRHLENVRRKFRRSHLRMQIRRITTFGYILLPETFLRRR